MNPLIVWGSRLEVGVPAIDRQHQELIRLANHLYLAMKAQRGREVLNQLFVDLANYTVWHFATEERLMLEHDYPHTKQHVQEHAALKSSVGELAGRARCGQLEITLGTMNFLRDWLSHHIQKTDRNLGKFLIANTDLSPHRSVLDREKPSRQ